mgnify:FL=1
MDGQQFRDWRQGMGWTQAQAGGALDVSKRAVIDWESGETAINANVASMCMLLKVARRTSSVEIDGDLEMAALFKMAEERIALADAMPSRGRPKSAADREITKRMSERLP